MLEGDGNLLYVPGTVAFGCDVLMDETETSAPLAVVDPGYACRDVLPEMPIWSPSELIDITCMRRELGRIVAKSGIFSRANQTDT